MEIKMQGRVIYKILGLKKTNAPNLRTSSSHLAQITLMLNIIFNILIITITSTLRNNRNPLSLRGVSSGMKIEGAKTC